MHAALAQLNQGPRVVQDRDRLEDGRTRRVRRLAGGLPCQSCLPPMLMELFGGSSMTSAMISRIGRKCRTPLARRHALRASHPPAPLPQSVTAWTLPLVGGGSEFGYVGRITHRYSARLQAAPLPRPHRGTC